MRLGNAPHAGGGLLRLSTRGLARRNYGACRAITPANTPDRREIGDANAPARAAGLGKRKEDHPI